MLNFDSTIFTTTLLFQCCTKFSIAEFRVKLFSSILHFITLHYKNSVLLNFDSSFVTVFWCFVVAQNSTLLNFESSYIAVFGFFFASKNSVLLNSCKFLGEEFVCRCFWVLGKTCWIWYELSIFYSRTKIQPLLHQTWLFKTSIKSILTDYSTRKRFKKRIKLINILSSIHKWSDRLVSIYQFFCMLSCFFKTNSRR